MEALVAVSGLILGKEMAVQTISSTTSSILSKINAITDNYDKGTIKLFEELDIKFKLDIINRFIQTKHQSDTYCEAVSECIEYIKEIMIKIETEIENLKKEMELYKEKWLGNLSYSKFQEEFTKIKFHIEILDTRFDMLVKIIK